jgi:peptidoglycan-N-acetylglucosamine deacetylase
MPLRVLPLVGKRLSRNEYGATSAEITFPSGTFRPMKRGTNPRVITATAAALMLLLTVAIRFEYGQRKHGGPRKIYLTFDADMTVDMRRRLQEGRVHAWYSPGLLAYLDEQQTPVTLFVTGLFAETYPELMKQLGSNARFSIQNHTYDHLAFQRGCYGLPSTSDPWLKKYEIQKTQAIIYALTGTSPRYLRYPGLCHSLFDQLVAWGFGLKTSNAGLVSGDAFQVDPGVIVDRVISRAEPEAVVIMHLGGPNAPASESAVREIVPKLRQAGYSFEVLR